MNVTTPRRLPGLSLIPPGVKVFHPATREEWLELRRPYIGGSEIAALLGVSPYESPVSLYLKKTGMIPEFEGSERTRWGNRLEAAIAQGLAEDHDWKLIGFPAYLAHPTIGRWGCSLDFLIAEPTDAVRAALGDVRGPGVLEVKNVDGFVHSASWTDDEPPIYYLTQLQHQLGCAGLEWGVIGALKGGNRGFAYYYRRHEPTQKAIAAALSEFDRRIASGECYPMDQHEATLAGMLAAYPGGLPDEFDMSSDNEMHELVALFDRAADAKKQADAAVKVAEGPLREVKARIIEKVGNHEVVVVGDRLVSAKVTERAGFTVAPTSYRTVGVKTVKPPKSKKGAA